MKIAIAGGHSKAAPGAHYHIDEYECDRAYVKALIPALQAAGHSVVDCSNEKGDENSELAEEVRLANASAADVFMAFHFNSKSEHEDEPDGNTTGTECWYHQGSGPGRELAARMSANVAAALGVRDRGAKPGTFYVLRKTTMTAVLLEVCFVDDADDVAAWHRTSWDALTKAVVDAIGGAQSATSAPAPEPAPAPAPETPAAPVARDQWIAALQAECNAQGFSKQAVDGIYGPNTLAGCPTCRRGAKGGITRLLQEKLISLGYSCGGYGADGTFGAGTDASVRAFQRDHGLTQDGIVGPATWAVLLSL